MNPFILVPFRNPRRSEIAPTRAEKKNKIACLYRVELVVGRLLVASGFEDARKVTFQLDILLVLFCFVRRVQALHFDLRLAVGQLAVAGGQHAARLPADRVPDEAAAGRTALRQTGRQGPLSQRAAAEQLLGLRRLRPPVRPVVHRGLSVQLCFCFSKKTHRISMLPRFYT